MQCMQLHDHKNQCSFMWFDFQDYVAHVVYAAAVLWFVLKLKPHKTAVWFYAVHEVYAVFFFKTTHA